MDNKQKVSMYALAKVLGYEKSLDDFISEYSQYYEEAVKEFSSKPIEPAKIEAVKNPMRSGYGYPMN